jgi:hypothetical protein
MKKLMILLLLIFCSCGTRKTDTQQRDSIYVENNYSQGSKIVLGNTFTYRPFDNSKPMELDGKTYKNAIVSNDKSQTIIKWKYANITKTITLEKTKSTTRTDYTFLFLGMFLIIVVAVFIWFKMGNYF